MFVFDAYLVAMIVFHVSVIRSDDEVATPDRSTAFQNDLRTNSEQDGHKEFHKQAENGE